MLKIKKSFQCFVLLILLLQCGYTIISTDLQAERHSPGLPLIYEYIDSFQFQTDDVRNLLANQFVNLTLNPVSTSYTNLSSYIIKKTYNGSSRSIRTLTQTKIQVINDSITMNINYLAHVKHTLNSKNYTCNTTISPISFNYTKEIDFSTGNALISAATFAFGNKDFVPVCTETPASKDLDRINEALNALDGSSLLIELQKVFKPVPDYLASNAKAEHLPRTYNKNPYIYNLSNYVVPIDVSSVNISTFQEHGLSNALSGAIPGTSHQAQTTPTYLSPYTTLYTKDFILNLVQYSVKNYDKWKGIMVNADNVSKVPRGFKFRLIDLEFVLQGVVDQYPQSYLEPVEFICDISAMGDSILDTANQVINQTILWSCKGFLKLASGDVLLMNFVAKIRHTIIIIGINGGTLSIYSNRLNIQSTTYDNAPFQVINENLANKYIEEQFNDFRQYTIGSYLMVKPGSTIYKLTSEGLWVG